MNDRLTRDNRLGKASEIGDPLIDKMYGQRSCIDLIMSAAINRYSAARSTFWLLWLVIIVTDARIRREPLALGNRRLFPRLSTLERTKES
jgi:hypothetical protein